MSQMKDTIQSSLDKIRYDFIDEIHRRLLYHAGGELPEWCYWDDLSFYSEDLGIELAQALANEIDQQIMDGMRLPPHLITSGNLIQPVEYKLILPEPPVPVHQSFVTTVTQDDIERWRNAGSGG